MFAVCLSCVHANVGVRLAQTYSQVGYFGWECSYQLRVCESNQTDWNDLPRAHVDPPKWMEWKLPNGGTVGATGTVPDYVGLRTVQQGLRPAGD